MVNIKDVYVGDLFIQKSNIDSCDNMYNVGFNKYDSRFLNYEHFFSIFLKIGEKYLCLENGEIYSKNTNNYVSRMYLFERFVSNKDKSLIIDGNIDNILNVFNSVFIKTNLPNFLKNNLKFKLCDIYFCETNVETLRIIDDVVYYNTALTQLYKRSYCYGETIVKSHSSLKSRENNDCSVESYYISPCIKINNGYLNIHTNSFHNILKHNKKFNIIRSFNEIITNNNKMYNIYAINDMYNKTYKKIL